MPELIRIQTKSWELSIWGGDIQEAQSRYFRTLDKRGVVGPRLPYSVSLSSGVTVEDVGCCVGYSVESCRNILCSSPIFFENAQYQFELIMSVFKKYWGRTQNIAARLNRITNTATNIFYCNPT